LAGFHIDDASAATTGLDRPFSWGDAVKADRSAFDRNLNGFLKPDIAIYPE
jgi:hypothetical protein